MLVFKNAKICTTPTRTLKFALPQMETPNMNRWNIGHVGHVGLMLFVSLSLALGRQREHNFQ